LPEEEITEIGIEPSGRLFVRPKRVRFPHIYRSAMEVHWDEQKGVLFGAVPREWSLVRWYTQIVAAVADEYGVQLKFTPSTIWTNVPDTVRAAIESGGIE
jgi:hypothetical protein